MNLRTQIKSIEKKLKDIENSNPNVYIFRLPQDQILYENHVEKPNDITIAIKVRESNEN